MNHDVIREQILRLLYDHQEAYPRSKGMYESQIASKLGGVDISFALYYLEQKALIVVAGSYIRITAEGIDFLEKTDKQRLLEMGKA